MNNWPYAQKVVEMSAVGGPDAYDALLMAKGYDDGYADGYAGGSDDRASEDAIAMAVVGGVAALIGGIGVLVTHLLHKRCEERQQSRIDTLEAELQDKRSLAVENNIAIRFALPAMKCLPTPIA